MLIMQCLKIIAGKLSGLSAGMLIWQSRVRFPLEEEIF